MVSPPDSSPRRPLHERSGSDSNKTGAVRLVPRTPPHLHIGSHDDIYSRTALPTHPSHVLSPVGFQGQGCALDESRDNVSELEQSLKSQPSTPSLRPSSIQTVQSPTGSSSRSRPTSTKFKHVALQPGGKTFSVLDILSSRDTSGASQQTSLPSSSSHSTLKAPFAEKPTPGRLSASSTNSLVSPPRSPASGLPGSSATTPLSPHFKSPSPTPGHISQSPYNFDIFGGLRQVPKTPEQKSQSHLDHPDYFPFSSATPSLQETTDDGRTSQSRSHTSHSLTTQSSFLTDSDTSTVPGNENYKVYPLESSPSARSIAPSVAHSFAPSVATSVAPSVAGTVVHYSPTESLGSRSASTAKKSESSTESEGNYVVYAENTPHQRRIVTPITTAPSGTADSSPDNRSPETYNPAYDITPEQSPTGTPIRSLLGSDSASRSTSGADSGNYQVFESSSPIEEVPESAEGSQIPDSRRTSAYNSEGSQAPGSSAQSSAYIPERPSNVPGKYSQESLVVAPLRTSGGPSNDKRDSLSSPTKAQHRDISLASLTSDNPNNPVQNNQALLPLSRNIGLPDPTKFTIPGSWAAQALSRSSVMQASPHQWSSQLSTVLSESDGASHRNSREWSDSRGGRSSGFPSINSKNMLSLRGSSHREGDFDGSNVSLGSLDRPLPAHMRSNRRDTRSTGLTSSDDYMDEYSDRLSEMPDLRSRPSRSTLSNRFSWVSSDGRTNSMRSYSSSGRYSYSSSRPGSQNRPLSRASRTTSLLQKSVPEWARIYYGSGERKYLAAPGSSTEGSDSRPQSSMRSGSPDTSNFPLSIYSPRRRPREAGGLDGRNRDSVAIDQIQPASRRSSVIVEFKKRWTQTSSVWSPHLQTDRRAARMTIWAAPSVTWSTEGNMFGRRNVQVIMFVFGFIFPFGMLTSSNSFNILVPRNF